MNIEWRRLVPYAVFTLAILAGMLGLRNSNQEIRDTQRAVEVSAQEQRRQICEANDSLVLALHSSLHLLTTEERIVADPEVAQLHADFHAILAEATPDFCGEDFLGPYREQKVRNRVEGVSGPALRYGETTRITGTLCSKAKEPLAVLTTITWQAVDRTGTFVTVGVDVPQVREPGCVEYEFRNPMPTEVVAASEAIRANGGAAVWVVTGFEVPQLPDGSRGARQAFTSESFEIVP